MMKYVALALLAFYLISCSNEELSKPSLEKQLKQRDILLDDSFRFEGDSVVIPNFKIELNYSEKVKNRLNLDKETVIVRAIFSGIPKDTLNEDYLNFGKMYLNDHEIELWNSDLALFSDIRIAKEVFNSLSDTNFEVLINIYSGRKSALTNLLHTEVLQDNINSISGKSHKLDVKLLSE